MTSPGARGDSRWRRRRPIENWSLRIEDWLFVLRGPAVGVAEIRPTGRRLGQITNNHFSILSFKCTLQSTRQFLNPVTRAQRGSVLNTYPDPQRTLRTQTGPRMVPCLLCWLRAADRDRPRAGAGSKSFGPSSNRRVMNHTPMGPDRCASQLAGTRLVHAPRAGLTREIAPQRTPPPFLA